MTWLWRKQREVGSAVGEDILSDALMVPVKSLHARLTKIPDVKAAVDNYGLKDRKVRWCYYARRNPLAKTTDARAARRVPGRVPEVQPEDKVKAPRDKTRRG